MMKPEKPNQTHLLAVVSAAVTQLPSEALIQDWMRPSTVRDLLPLVNPRDLSNARLQKVRVRELSRWFCYADDAPAACAAYELAVRLVDPEHWAARIFLQDLAEWLMLPPREYRRLLASRAGCGTPKAA
jgi:hypothetical protein